MAFESETDKCTFHCAPPTRGLENGCLATILCKLKLIHYQQEPLFISLHRECCNISLSPDGLFFLLLNKVVLIFEIFSRKWKVLLLRCGLNDDSSLFLFHVGFLKVNPAGFYFFFSLIEDALSVKMETKEVYPSPKLIWLSAEEESQQLHEGSERKQRDHGNVWDRDRQQKRWEWG